MGENCKDCIYIDTLKREVADLKEIVKGLETRTSDLERRSDVAQERMDTMYTILTEIKDSINRIASKIDDIEKRPNHLLWSVAGAVVAAVILAGMKQFGA